MQKKSAYKNSHVKMKYLNKCEYIYETFLKYHDPMIDSH